MKDKLYKTDYVLVCIFLFIIDFTITGYTSMYLWNNIISPVFNVSTLSFWQTWVIAMCISYFIPKAKKDIEDYSKLLLTDIIYTLLIWFFAFLAVTNIGF